MRRGIERAVWSAGTCCRCDTLGARGRSPAIAVVLEVALVASAGTASMLAGRAAVMLRISLVCSMMVASELQLGRVGV